jgi:ABC-type glycerol-3-phosphate transport system permease component
MLRAFPDILDVQDFGDARQSSILAGRHRLARRATQRNYVDVLETTDFPQYFLNSVLVSWATSELVTIIASATGYAFSRFRFRGKQVVAFLLLLTHTFPLVMVIPPIYRIMGSLHRQVRC